MLYLVYGNQLKPARQKYHAWLSSVTAKSPEAEVFIFTPENFERAGFEEMIVGQTLFTGKFIVTGLNLLSDKETREYLVEHLAEIAASPNIFIFLDGSLDKALIKKLEKVATKIVSFEQEEKEIKKFNPFVLSDAWGERDKKKLWILLQKAERQGLDTEEIFWLLWGSLRNIASYQKTADKTKLKMHPFVRSKVASFARNYSVAETDEYLWQMLDIFHRSRRGEGELDIMLEGLVLGL